MKPFLALVPVLLAALCGCAKQPQNTVAPTEIQVLQTAPATEPAGIYQPDSAPETASGGAVRVFPLQQNGSIGFRLMDDGVLLFSGSERTTLTKYSGENLYIAAVAHLNCCIFPSDPAVQVSETGVTYYDERRNALVFLNEKLQEVRSIVLPEDICGAPAVSADLKALYYCTDASVRCIDLDSGMDRLLKEMSFSDQRISALHCADTVLACTVWETDGTESRLYLAVDNGRLLEQTLDDTDVYTLDDVYFALRQDGVYRELLTGDREQGPTLLTPDNWKAAVYPALGAGGVVLFSENYDTKTIHLDFYDLRNGNRSAALTLQGLDMIWSLQSQNDQPVLWFLRYDPAFGCEALYCWDLSQSPTGDQTFRMSARHTAESPDQRGLAACRDIADTLFEVYGVQILLWTDATAVQPWDYTLAAEHQIPLIREKLAQLEELLYQFPEGFLKQTAEGTACGHIRICLVRSICGNPEAADALSTVNGLQFWDEYGNAYVCLSTQVSSLEQNACHELFHVIESRVMTLTKAYDDWNDLNPSGFAYDYGYAANLAREDHRWTSGSTRAFIDTYSMSFPKEDRARIMEYAMMPGKEALFESETMQKKLRCLCQGIRQAFGMKKYAQSLPWEQYLSQPLY